MRVARGSTVKTGRVRQRVVVVALLDGARVLLGHRSPQRVSSPNVWDFPGGHVEEGESLSEALTREILEELGVVIALGDAQPVLHVETEIPELDFMVWATRSWRGDVRNAQPDEHDDLGWFTLEECDDLDLADESYRPLLRRLLGDDSREPR